MKKPRYFQMIINRIKELAAKQRGLRRSSKTKSASYVQGSAYEHYKNRLELRHLHLVYANLRGKEFDMPKRAYVSNHVLLTMTNKYDPESVSNRLVASQEAA